jgi:hypothetical protein
MHIESIRNEAVKSVFIVGVYDYGSAKALPNRG